LSGANPFGVSPGTSAGPTIEVEPEDGGSGGTAPSGSQDAPGQTNPPGASTGTPAPNTTNAAAASAATPPPAAAADAATLVVNDLSWVGWTSVRFTRGCERVPSDFHLEVTEAYPFDPSQMGIKAGQACVFKVGNDPIVTGYVDRVTMSITAGGHTVTVQGRSKCGDLVDCSAMANGFQIQAPSALVLAQKLAAPFGITVSSLSGSGQQIQQFNVNLAESPFEIIERVCRWSALLAYDGTDGNLILASAGASTMASGVQQGVNVQSASVTLSMDERFSEIIAVISATDILQQYSNGGATTANQIASVQDETVPRYRPHVLVSEQGIGSLEIAKQRANWEVARRYGRSQAIRVTIDTWRDSAGLLWAPNAILPQCDLPACKIKTSDATWVISEIVFSRDDRNGTTAELLIMPKEAFLPNPILLYPFDSQVAQAVQPNGGAAAPQ